MHFNKSYDKLKYTNKFYNIYFCTKALDPNSQKTIKQEQLYNKYISVIKPTTN